MPYGDKTDPKGKGARTGRGRGRRHHHESSCMKQPMVAGETVTAYRPESDSNVAIAGIRKQVLEKLINQEN